MTIHIPEHLSIPQCPKCGMTLLDGGVRTAHHNGAHYDINNVWPCIKLTMENPSSDELDDGLMDHLCRVCSRCKFGWVEQVHSSDDIYAPPEPEGDDHEAAQGDG